MIAIATSKLYKNKQTSIPAEIRKRFNIDEDTIIEWGISENGKTEINFRKKRKAEDLISKIDLGYKTNAVELKKELYKWIKKIFLDSSFIIGLFPKQDSLNNRAVNLNNEKHLLSKDCYISNNIINEVITVVGNKTKDLKIVQELYYTLKDSFNILNEFDIPYFNDKVLNTYLKFNCKLSFTDIGVIEIMKANDINYVATFDKELKKYIQK